MMRRGGETSKKLTGYLYLDITVIIPDFFPFSGGHWALGKESGLERAKTGDGNGMSKKDMEDGRHWLYFKEHWRAEPSWYKVVVVKKRRAEEFYLKDSPRQPEKWMQQVKEARWIPVLCEI